LATYFPNPSEATAFSLPMRRNRRLPKAIARLVVMEQGRPKPTESMQHVNEIRMTKHGNSVVEGGLSPRRLNCFAVTTYVDRILRGVKTELPWMTKATNHHIQRSTVSI
jgi:hypothetical protein